MCGGGLYEEGLIRGVTQVLRKRWAYLEPIRGGAYTRGWGAYRRRNTVYRKSQNLTTICKN